MTRTATMCAATIALLIAAAPGPAAAAGDGPRPDRWGTLRFQGMLTAPLGENNVRLWNDCGVFWLDFLSFAAAIETNNTWGAVASFEYVLGGRIGLEAAFHYWYDIVELRYEAGDFTVEGSPNFVLPTIGMNYHLHLLDQTDLYAGGFISLGVIATGVSFDVDVDSDFALGVKLGADYLIDDHWSLGGTLDYVDFGELNFSLLPPGLEGIVCDNGLFGIGHMNVVTFTAGIGYRF